MQTRRTVPLPRRYTIYLLRLYMMIGVVSMIAGAYLTISAYQLRVLANGQPVHGAILAMLAGGVVIGFGVWRCLLASFHLYRLRRKRNGPGAARLGD